MDESNFTSLELEMLIKMAQMYTDQLEELLLAHDYDSDDEHLNMMINLLVAEVVLKKLKDSDCGDSIDIMGILKTTDEKKGEEQCEDEKK